MRYTEVIEKLDSDKGRKEIYTKLASSPRNKALNMFQDYYDGRQWLLNRSTSSGLSFNGNETRFTRSEKEMWKPFDPKLPGKGLTTGELKIFNITKAAVNTYADYARGDESEDVKISIENQEHLTNQANSLFEDLNNFVIHASQSLSINSVAITKYTAFEASDMARGALDKIMNADGDKNITGLISLIDPREIEPLYWHNMIRGYIQFYPISKSDAKEKYGVTKRNKSDCLYWEVWTITDDGSIQLIKCVEEYEVEKGINETYSNLPFVLQANKKSTVFSFDYEYVEDGDVEDLIELQDSMNAYLTDVTNVIRKVAFPMLKISDDFAKTMQTVDLERLRSFLSTMNTSAGTVLTAPIERISGDSSVPDAYLDKLMNQFYLLTGIPQSVFNSEGLGGVANATLEKVMQSLKVKVGQKRTAITKLIQKSVAVALGDQTDLDIDVIYPRIFAISSTDKLQYLMDGSKSRLLPKKYVTKKYIEELGDGDDIAEIEKDLQEEDGQIKSNLEASQVRMNNLNEMNINRQVNSKNRDLKELDIS